MCKMLWLLSYAVTDNLTSFFFKGILDLVEASKNRTLTAKTCCKRTVHNKIISLKNTF